MFKGCKGSSHVLVLVLVLLFTSCSYKPPADPNARPGQGLNFFPIWYDNMIGAEYGELYAAELPVLHNTRVQQGVEDLGNYLVHTYYGEEPPPYEFQFYVVDMDIVNAFAFPGGKVFVFRGLLQDIDSEAELASVLSHEIGHVVARHGTKSISKGILWQSVVLTSAAVLESEDHHDLALATYLGGSVFTSLRMLKYSRDYEREADWIAVHNIYKAGYDPNGMISLFEHFKEKDSQGNTPKRAMMFLSTHPAPDERQRNAAAQMPGMVAQQAPKSDEFGFAAMRAELQTLPPAPKELSGKPVLALTSLDSLGNAIATGRADDLRRERNRDGTETVKLYVPSNTEWTDTGLDLSAGQQVDFRVEPRGGVAYYGALKAEIRRSAKDSTPIMVLDGGNLTLPAQGRLYLGINDTDFSDNTGWYVVTVRIHAG